MLKRFLVLVVFLTLGLTTVVYFLGASYLKRKIKLHTYTITRIETTYDDIKVVSLNPLKINISNLSGKKTKDFSFSIKTLTLELNLKDIILNWNNKFVKFHLVADQFNVFYKSIPAPGTEKPTEMPKNVSAEVIANMRDYLKISYGIHELDLLIKIGKFDYLVQMPSGTYRLYGNNTTLKISNLETPIDFTLNSYLYSDAHLGPLSRTYIPVNIHSQITVKNAAANILKSDFQIAGIKNTVSGLVSLKNMDFDTTLKTHIPKIEDLNFFKTYKDKFPISDVRGAVALEMVLRGNINNLLGTQIKGILNLKSLGANVKYKTDEARVQGPIHLNLSTSFVLTNLVPSISAATWQIRLDDCTLAYKDLFLKESGVKLMSEGTVSYITNLTIDRFKLLFHTLDVSVQGTASHDRSSDISFKIKPFKLQDFKAFLPNNKNHNISGDVEVDAQIIGFLNQPKYLSVIVKKLQASNLRYFLKYKNDKISLEGPFSLNLFGNLALENAQVTKGSITGNSDLTSLVVTQDNQVRKTNTDLFKLSWLIQAKNSRLNIEKLNITTYLMSFELSGRPPMTLDDSFDLKLNLESLNWKKAKTYLPAGEWLNTVVDMNNKGMIHLQGKLNPFEIQQSKWHLNTELETTISTLAMPFNFHLSNQPAPPNAPPETPLTTPPPFIRDSALLKTVRWNHKVNIQRVTFKDSPAQFQNVSLTANLSNNKLSVAGDIGEIFKGKMSFTDVVIPLTEPDPKIKYKMTSNNLSFPPLVEFILPEYKNLISGVGSFNVAGYTRMPGTLHFKKDLVAKGNFVIPVSEVHTLKLINEVKQQFSAIKDFGIPTVLSVGNLSASTQSEFEIKNSSIQLTRFNAKTHTGDEMNLDGNVKFDLESNIAGVLKLVTIPVRGDFLQANKNSAGQIEIPILIQGNLIQPKWNFAGNTLEKMTQNFIDYQKNQVKTAVDRKVAEAKEHAQTEIDKKKKEAEIELTRKKKEFESEALKKLDGLFK